MDSLEKFIRKVAYKFPKGYPDVNNPADRALLFELLGTKEILSETTLSRSELLKYDSRISDFVDKFLREEPFEAHQMEPVYIETLIVDGHEFTPDDDGEEIKTAIASSKKPIKITGISNDEKIESTTSVLKKTSEFGGKGSGSGTKKEDMALKDASTKLAALNNGQAVTLVVNGKAYEGITGMTSIPKTPKADFAYTAGDQKVIFVSHKDGKTAKDFQQYGGLTQTGIVNHPEVEDFIQAVKNQLQNPTEMERGSGFKRKINDPELMRKLVYGPEFNPEGPYNEDNVQVLYQGTIQYKQMDGKPGVFLVGSNHTINNPNVPEGDYAPYFYATFRRNRNQFGIKDVRFGAYTAVFRPSAKEI